jgi:nicotinate-nucleotide--dimethylbenzimidazole phosphoribosyltransferase
MNLRILPVDPHWLAAAERHQNDLTKPPGSLGRLETIANRCAAIFGSLTPPVDAARIVIFAADHGVAEEGVSAYPREVTAQMVLNFRQWRRGDQRARAGGRHRSCHRGRGRRHAAS